MVPPVSTICLEERTRMAAIIEVSLRLAGDRDPELLLKGVSQMARQIMRAQYASVGIRTEDGQTISSRVFSSERHAAAVMKAIPVPRPGPLANMLLARRALRLRNLASESLGFDFLPQNYQLSSALGVPFSISVRF